MLNSEACKFDFERNENMYLGQRQPELVSADICSKPKSFINIPIISCHLALSGERGTAEDSNNKLTWNNYE